MSIIVNKKVPILYTYVTSVKIYLSQERNDKVLDFLH